MKKSNIVARADSSLTVGRDCSRLFYFLKNTHKRRFYAGFFYPLQFIPRIQTRPNWGEIERNSTGLKTILKKSLKNAEISFVNYAKKQKFSLLL